MDFFPVTYEDIRVLNPQLDDTQALREQAQALLDLAEARLVQHLPTLPQRVESGEVSLTIVKGLLIEVVSRVLNNPFPGMQSMQSGAGPYQLTQKPVDASDRIRFTRNDLAGLLPRRANGMYSLQMKIGW